LYGLIFLVAQKCVPNLWFIALKTAFALASSQFERNSQMEKIIEKNK